MKVGLTGRRDRTGFRNDSTVSLNFLFERQTGFFLLQVYTWVKVNKIVFL